MHTQHCRYWCPGAKAPGHLYPQCWLNIHCTTHVLNQYHTDMLHFIENNIKQWNYILKQITHANCLRVNDFKSRIHVKNYVCHSSGYCWDYKPGTLYWHDLTLIAIWISNYIHHVWDEITYPFPNFNGATVEVPEWIRNFIPHFTKHVITYPCLIKVNPC